MGRNISMNRVVETEPMQSVTNFVGHGDRNGQATLGDRVWGGPQ